MSIYLQIDSENVLAIIRILDLECKKAEQDFAICSLAESPSVYSERLADLNEAVRLRAELKEALALAGVDTYLEVLRCPYSRAAV